MSQLHGPFNSNICLHCSCCFYFIVDTRKVMFDPTPHPPPPVTYIHTSSQVIVQPRQLLHVQNTLYVLWVPSLPTSKGRILLFSVALLRLYIVMSWLLGEARVIVDTGRVHVVRHVVECEAL